MNATKTKGDWIPDLRSARFVDLTHTFFPGQPCHSTLPEKEVRAMVNFDSGFASLMQEFRFVGQWGTHINAPSALSPIGHQPRSPFRRTGDLTSCRARCSRASVEKPHTAPSLTDVRAREAAHGRIRPAAFVALRTDWSLRWPNTAEVGNLCPGGFSHRPAWSREVLKFLIEERSIVANSH